MIYEGLKSPERETVRKLRIKFDVLRDYLDDEIAGAYHVYCETFYAAGWTDVNEEAFIQWATTPPLTKN